MQKVGFGGGCHWCTEAVFSVLRGVSFVEQGWINSLDLDAESFSEAVLVHFDETVIALDVLVEIHLLTHKATSNHSFRKKYRSAIYTFSPKQESEANDILVDKRVLFDKPLVTKVYPFLDFKANKEKFLNYYQNNPEKPFCQTYIEPKLQMLLSEYKKHLKTTPR